MMAMLERRVRWEQATVVMINEGWLQDGDDWLVVDDGNGTSSRYHVRVTLDLTAESPKTTMNSSNHLVRVILGRRSVFTLTSYMLRLTSARLG